MRIIEGTITEELQQFINEASLAKVDAYPVSTYRQLVKHTAKLAYLNKDHLLFFRGQGRDYRNRVGASTFYPSIYRGDYVQRREIDNRFKLLDHAARQLCNLFDEEGVQGRNEVRRKRLIQWCILQHYEICATPLLDITQSLRVACSFAQINAKEEVGFVYVFGFPYVMNRISHNSEHDLVNIRLLSICPPDALRPYFQEGYLAATEDITNEYTSKSELDFRNRLIAKFKISRESRFWGQGFSKIPKSVLYPKGDLIERLSKFIIINIKSQLQPAQLGEFIQKWTDVENIVLGIARDLDPRMFTMREAIDRIGKESLIDRELIYELHELRKFRNVIVHEPREIKSEEIDKRIHQVNDVKQRLTHTVYHPG